MDGRRSTRAFAAGVLLGLVLASAGAAVGAMGYDAWKDTSEDYKRGYVSGFLAMANLARNLEPGGWVDSNYPQPPQPKPFEWVATIDRLYTNPEYQKQSVLTVLNLAAKDLVKKYGPPADPTLRAQARLRDTVELVKRKQAAKQAAEGTRDPATASKVSPATPAKPSATYRPRQPPKPRKWCRCDGVDPKAARAARRAKHQEDEAKQQDGSKPADAKPGQQAKPVDQAKPKAPAQAPAPH